MTELTLPDSADTPPTVVVRDLHLTYDVHIEGIPTLRQIFATGERSRPSIRVEALKGISLEISRGEIVGIVGSNGSGKSTLLGAIAGLRPPTSGEILVSAQPRLLAVGSALKGDLSGRRNIVIGALAMGLSLDVVYCELDAVIDFTDIGDAIDRPMRTYSSGMRARLAFAVATMRTPEILLMDEALAVGDHSFRHRSLERVRELQASAGTVLVVSHNLDEIRNCNRAVWLQDGVICGDGDVEEVLAAYEASQGAQ